MKKIILSLILAVLQIVNLSAQERPPFSDKVVNINGAKYIPYHKGNYTFAARKRGDDQFIKPKDFVSARTSIVKINDILNQSVWINAPQGVEVQSWMSTDRDNSDVTGRPNGIDWRISPYYMGNEKPFFDDHAGISFFLRLNTIIDIVGYSFEYSEVMWAMPEKIGEFYGYPVYHHDKGCVAIISKKGVPFYLPVSREMYLKNMIKLLSIDDEKLKAEIDSSMAIAYSELEKSKPYLDNTTFAQMKTTLDEQYREMLKNMPSKSPEVKAKIKVFEDALHQTPIGVLRLPARIAFDGDKDSADATGLVKPTQSGIDIVIPNPALIDSGRIHTSPQLLVITLSLNNAMEDKRLYENSNGAVNLKHYTKWKFFAEIELWKKVFNIIEK
ncbi:MAG: hypothetical protein PHC95_14540 [Parabacteroides sp.]|nr:hypothetical protein [Parabacteroides sp.]